MGEGGAGARSEKPPGEDGVLPPPPPSRGTAGYAANVKGGRRTAAMAAMRTDARGRDPEGKGGSPTGQQESRGGWGGEGYGDAVNKRGKKRGVKAMKWVEVGDVARAGVASAPQGPRRMVHLRFGGALPVDEGTGASCQPPVNAAPSPSALEPWDGAEG